MKGSAGYCLFTTSISLAHLNMERWGRERGEKEKSEEEEEGGGGRGGGEGREGKGSQ